jgi:hypothetical protein
MFVSWQIVSSKIATVYLPQITMSGRKEANKFWVELVVSMFISANSSCSLSMHVFSYKTNIRKTSSCLVMYLASTEGEEQFESTCLLVWGFPWLQSWLFESKLFFYLTKFTLVGRIWWSALRANLNIRLGESTRTEHQRDMSFLILPI